MAEAVATINRVLETDMGGYTVGRHWTRTGADGQPPELRVMLDEVPCRVLTKPSLLALGLVMIEPEDITTPMAAEWPVSAQVEWTDGRQEWLDGLAAVPVLVQAARALEGSANV